MIVGLSWDHFRNCFEITEPDPAVSGSGFDMPVEEKPPRAFRIRAQIRGARKLFAISDHFECELAAGGLIVPFEEPISSIRAPWAVRRPAELSQLCHRIPARNSRRCTSAGRQGWRSRCGSPNRCGSCRGTFRRDRTRNSLSRGNVCLRRRLRGLRFRNMPPTQPFPG